MGMYQLTTVLTACGIALMSTIGVLLWYIVRSTVTELRALEKDLSEHKLDVANNYAKTNDVKSLYKEVCNKLDDLQSTVNIMAVSVATLAAKVHPVQTKE